MQQKLHEEFRISSHLASELEEAYKEADETFTIADLGCGQGLYHEDMKEKLSELGDKEVEVLGFDINQEAREYSKDNNTALTDLKEYGIPLQDSSVDFVYSNHLRCQIEEYELEEIRKEADRVLRNNNHQFHIC